MSRRAADTGTAPDMAAARPCKAPSAASNGEGIPEAGRKAAKPKKHRKPVTPRSQIKNALRRLWLQSRERHAALRSTNYRCEICGVKQSTAKGRVVRLEVHHRDGIPDWDALVALIQRRLLPPSDRLMPVCKPCHNKQHHEE